MTMRAVLLRMAIVIACIFVVGIAAMFLAIQVFGASQVLVSVFTIIGGGSGEILGMWLYDRITR